MNLRRIVLGAGIMAVPFFYNLAKTGENIYMSLHTYSVEESTKKLTTDERLSTYFDSSNINDNDREFCQSLERISRTEPESAAKIAVKIWPKAAMDLYEKSGYKGIDRIAGTEVTTKIINVFRKQPEKYFKRAVKREEKKGNYSEAIDLCEKTAEFYENAVRFNEDDSRYSEFYKKKAEKFMKKAKKLEKKWAKESYKRLMAGRKLEEKENGK